MKTLTNNPTFKYLVLFVAAGVTALSSCKKDETSPDANVKLAAFVKVTNALEGSAAQDFYLDDVKQNGASISYGQSSSYYTSVEGNHVGKFTNSGSTTANATLNASFTGKKYYSLYYTGGASASSSSYVMLEDDLTAVEGKAKVRFVQLSSALSSGVDFGISAANKLVTNLAYKAASAYNTVDANTTFFLYAAGSANASLNLPVTLQAGKIYTIYISGNTTASLKYNLVVQN